MVQDKNKEYMIYWAQLNDTQLKIKKCCKKLAVITEQNLYSDKLKL